MVELQDSPYGKIYCDASRTYFPHETTLKNFFFLETTLGKKIVS